MKYVYIVFGNRTIGSRHWYQDKVFLNELKAKNYVDKLFKKFPKGAFKVEKEKVYE